MARLRMLHCLGLILTLAASLDAQFAPHIPAPKKYLGRFGDHHKDRLIPETLEVPGQPHHLGRFEVTNAQFEEFTRATAHVTDAEREGNCLGFSPEGKWGKVTELNWRSFAGAGREDYPVVCVSPNDAEAFTKWLSGLSKETYRLPTEAEWQYAACTGQNQTYPWGNAWRRKRANSLSYWLDRDLDEKTWTFALFEELAYPLARARGGTLTTRVDLLPPNAWGFQDMAGNVWEITRGGGADSAEKRVSVRGGSWHNHLQLVGCQARDNLPDSSYRDDGVGFRVLLEPTKKAR